MSQDPIPANASLIDTIPPAISDTTQPGLRERAGELLQTGVDLAKQRPLAAAAVVGGVAATAAAAIYGGAKLAQRRAIGTAEPGFDETIIDPQRVPDAIPTPIE